MNPVPPLTTILIECLLSGGAEQTNSLAHARAFARYGFYSSRMLKKSASLSCSFGLFGLSGLFGWIRLTRWTRQTGFVSDVQTSEIPACPQSFSAAC